MVFNDKIDSMNSEDSPEFNKQSIAEKDNFRSLFPLWLSYNVDKIRNLKICSSETCGGKKNIKSLIKAGYEMKSFNKYSFNINYPYYVILS